MTDAIIFNIQRYTIHDGPGIRTELFLKGCPLKCSWCSNPEGQNPRPQPGVYSSRCIGFRQCGACTENCSSTAIQIYRNKLVNIDRSLCQNCLRCVEKCPAEAIKQWGKYMTVDECMKIIKRDKGYYDRSGGGVTVSGGEPLLQSLFVEKLFQSCKKEGISTCCESTLHVPWENIEQILPYTDVVISDIKHMDFDTHKKWTGAGNKLILENLQLITKRQVSLILRIPVIPGINDDTANINATADFILGPLQGQIRTLQLLSYMRLGEEKYASLNMNYPMKGLRFNRKYFQKHINSIAEYFNSRGIHCVVGTKEKE